MITTSSTMETYDNTQTLNMTMTVLVTTLTTLRKVLRLRTMTLETSTTAFNNPKNPHNLRPFPRLPQYQTR